MLPQPGPSAFEPGPPRAKLLGKSRKWCRIKSQFYCPSSTATVTLVVPVVVTGGSSSARASRDLPGGVKAWVDMCRNKIHPSSRRCLPFGCRKSNKCLTGLPCFPRGRECQNSPTIGIRCLHHSTPLPSGTSRRGVNKRGGPVCVCVCRVSLW